MFRILWRSSTRYYSSRSSPQAIVESILSCSNTTFTPRVQTHLSEERVVGYTSLIHSYIHANNPLEALRVVHVMHLEGIQPNRITFIEALSACGALTSLETGTKIHAWTVESGLESDSVLGTAVVNMYAKCGSLREARRVFEHIVRRDVVAWNAMILGYARNHKWLECIECFGRMQLEGMRPTKVTLIAVLSGVTVPVTRLKQCEDGLVQVAKETGLDSCVAVANCLINMYGKRGAVLEASAVFQGTVHKNTVTWSTMIAAYARVGDVKSSVYLFHTVLLEGTPVEETTLVNVLGICDVRLCRFIHRTVLHGRGAGIVVMTAIVTAFGRCGSVGEAREVFYSVQMNSVVLWNAMISVCVQKGVFHDALKMFREMQLHGSCPDTVSFVSAINACAEMEEFPAGRGLQLVCKEAGLEKSLPLLTSLVNLYSRARDLHEARSAFELISHPDLIAWNVFIAAHVENGEAGQALELFKEMKPTPDKITYLTVLDACSTGASFLPHGRLIHEEVHCRGLDRDIAVATAVVDMYVKCGSLDEAQSVFSGFPRPNVVMWNSLIGGFARHGRGAEVPGLVRQLQQDGVDADEVTAVGLLLACSHVGLLEDGCKCFGNLLQEQYTHMLPFKEELYVGVVDLLGRAGKLGEVGEFMEWMSEHAVGPTAAMWTSLLSACGVHGDLELARRAALKVLQLQPEHSAACVILSNSVLQNTNSCLT